MEFIKKLKSNKAFGDALRIGLILVVLGVLGMVGIFINEKVADKVGLTENDTFYNASEDVVDSIETGWDFMEIMVMVMIASVIIGLLFMILPMRL